MTDGLKKGWMRTPDGRLRFSHRRWLLGEVSMPALSTFNSANDPIDLTGIIWTENERQYTLRRGTDGMVRLAYRNDIKGQFVTA